MRKVLLLLVIFVIAAFVISANAEAVVVFDMGASSWVDVSATQNGLEMYANVNSNLDSETFSLDVGDSRTFYFATIGTTEQWVNWCDDFLNPTAITAHLDFDIPGLSQSVDGASVGFRGPFGFLQGWALGWDDPVIVNFGNGGQFSIELSCAYNANGWWQGPAGSQDIDLTIKLLQQSTDNAVPEPMSMALFGIGLLGTGYLRRKKSSK